MLFQSLKTSGTAKTFPIIKKITKGIFYFERARVEKNKDLYKKSLLTMQSIKIKPSEITDKKSREKLQNIKLAYITFCQQILWLEKDIGINKKEMQKNWNKLLQPQNKIFFKNYKSK